jgi:hypothetical protein
MCRKLIGSFTRDQRGSRHERARLRRWACDAFKDAADERHTPHVSLLEGPSVDRVAVANEPEYAQLGELLGGPLAPQPGASAAAWSLITEY